MSNYKIYLFSASAILWIGYFYLIYTYSVNVPSGDDYDLYLNSILKFKEANGLMNKINILFLQHNEHRPAIPRAVALLTTWLTGSCNFKTLILTGNVALMLLSMVIISQVRVRKESFTLLFILGIQILLIGFQSIDNSLWATGAIQNFFTLLFIVCTLRSVSKNRFPASILYIVLTLLCSVNGFLLIPVLGLNLAIRWKIKELIILAFLTCMGLFAYYYNYSTPMHTILFRDSEYNTLIFKLKYFLAFIGSSVLITEKINLGLTYIAGSILFIFSIFTLSRKQGLKFADLLILFVLMSALVTLITRANMGPQQAVSGRYRLYSLLLIAGCALKWYELLPGIKKMACLFFGGCVVFFSIQLKAYLPLAKSNKTYLSTGMQIFIGTQNPQFLFYPLPPLAGHTVIRAAGEGIYKPSF